MTEALVESTTRIRRAVHAKRSRSGACRGPAVRENNGFLAKKISAVALHDHDRPTRDLDVCHDDDGVLKMAALASETTHIELRRRSSGFKVSVRAAAF